MSGRVWERARRNMRGYEEAFPAAREWSSAKPAGPVRRPWLGEHHDPRCAEWIDLRYGKRVRWWRKGQPPWNIPL